MWGWIVGFALILLLLTLVLSVPRWKSNSNNHRNGNGVCPGNVFDVTSEDLWPCAAEAELQELKLGPQKVASLVPAVFPWDDKYNTLRLNVDLQYQRLPLFIVRPKSGCDVVKTIKLAQKYGLKISCRSGGHCNEAFSIQNPIVISIGSLNYVSLDECQGILTLGGGATQGQVFSAIAKANKKTFAFALAHRHHGSHTSFDFAINTGTASDVGLAGILSAGGVGFLQRKMGLTIDSIRSLNVALANGTIVKAKPNNSFGDLFMAVRGSGGGNYGVITEIELQLHEVGELIVFTISWQDWSQAAPILALWQSLAPSFPNELTQQLYFSIVDGATVPTVSSAGVYVGSDLAALESLLQPFLSIPTGSVLYERTTFQGQAAKFASGRKYNPFGYRRTQFVFTPLSNLGITTLISQFEAAVGIPGTHTIEFDPFGGKVAEIPLESSAFFPRVAKYWLLFVTTWKDQNDSAANLAWSETIFFTMRPFTSIYCYTGFVMMDVPNFLDAYYGSLLPTLKTIKTKYDPNNFFSFPQSIPPA